MDEKTLRFPTSMPAERVIEPEQFKQAAGFERDDQQLDFSTEPLPAEPSIKRVITAPEAPEAPAPRPGNRKEPLFVKVELYRRVLGEIDTIRSKLNELNSINKRLEQSEYNEEHHFDRMKQSVRIMHDRLLQVDKIIFK